MTRHPRLAPRSRRLALEALEDRSLLAVFYVSAATGNDGGAGSQASPFRSIQQAVNVAASNDSIFVAGGTYTYNPALDQTLAGLRETGVVAINSKALTIEGGYNAGNWNGGRDTSANPTIIDGQGTVRGVFLFSDQLGQGALAMSGFTIRNGFATGSTVNGGTDPNGFGGGISAILSFVNISGMVFENCTAQGAATTSEAGGSGAGGGMAFRSMAGTVNLSNITFTNNKALGNTGPERGGFGQGGGLFAGFSTVVASNMTFTSNNAIGGNSGGSGRTSNGFLADGQGGAMSFNLCPNVTLTGVFAASNFTAGGTSAGVGGGGFGGALFAEEGSLSISASTIRGNTAQGATGGTEAGVAFGGGIEMSNQNFVMDRVTVTGNRSIGGAGSGGVANGPPQGGGVASGASRTGLTTTITNSVIAGNSAEQAGTGSINNGGGGGGLSIQGTTANVVQSTIAGNTLNVASMFGLGVLAVPSNLNPVVTLQYTIVADHPDVTGSMDGAVATVGGATIRLDRVLFDGNTVNTEGNVQTVNASVFGNPLFVSPGAPNFDYHIRAGSAAENQATGSTTAVDITNTPRTGVPDIGAFEVASLGVAAPVGGGSGVVVTPPGPPVPPPPPAPSGAVAVGLATGVARMLSASGGVVFTVTPFAGFGGEIRVASADFNNDGVLDLVAGTGPGAATQVVVIDGATRQPLFANSPFEAAFTGGVFVSAGDITGDGVPDLIITPDQSGGPRVIIVDGATRQVIQSFFGIDDPNFRGGARTGVGDLNGDGIPELIVAAGFGGGPRVTVFDGANLRAGRIVAVANFFVFEENLRNGSFVATGDLNADGIADLIAGGGPGGAPRVLGLNGPLVYANNTSGVLANFFAGDQNARGGVRVAGKKLTSTAFADIIAGSGDIPRVLAYSGATPGGGTPPVLFDYLDPAGGAAGVYVG